MNQNMIIRLFIGVGLSVFLYSGCTTKKTIQAWVKEGMIEANQTNIFNAGNAEQRNDDAIISAAIKTKFASDGLLSGSKMNIDTNHGEVSLNGTARSQDHVDRALQLARSTIGVKRVRSNLIVQ
jgi:osmotically-inducible protein OsmY